MSISVENVGADLEPLEGAKILSAKIIGNSIRLTIEYHNFVVNGSLTGIYEVWRDGEGNGPGYLAYLGDGR